MKFEKFLVIILSMLLFSCGSDPFDVDISKSDVQLNFERFDLDFYAFEKDSTQGYNEFLLSKYGQFYKTYLKDITNLGAAGDPMLLQSIEYYLEDKYVKQLNDDVIKAYPAGSLDEVQQLLETSFKYYNHYFPERVVPDVLTFVSGFQFNIAPFDSTLAISLDLYLNPNYDNYALAGLPKYAVNQSYMDNIAPDAMRGWLSTEFEMPAKDEVSLLDYMIHHGKILYVMDAVMPNTADSLKIGYSASQMEFCENNEFMIWAHFLEQSLLHETDEAKYLLYLREGPFTTGLPKESPSRIAVWSGWQIIRKYMDSNPEVSINQLLVMQDSKLILSRSKYKPSK
ncbi:MAG: hypothetical protein MRY83_09950 [Flavobacteriales bacterium]|nr:hypothetical protein [Flavobacteriales bacterium]